MNVSKIQTLSKQHALLKGFHKTCNCTSIELRIHELTSADQFDDILDSTTTRLIISDVRVSLLKEMERIEVAIIKETQRCQLKAVGDGPRALPAKKRIYDGHLLKEI